MPCLMRRPRIWRARFCSPLPRASAAVGGFAHVRREVPAHLLMVGDGPDLDNATRMATELGIEDYVHFLGEQDQVRQLLSISDAFLLPSAQESFGLAALEAMACEVPVVASNVGGLPEVIDHGITGYRHDPADLGGSALSPVAALTDASLTTHAAPDANAK